MSEPLSQPTHALSKVYQASPLSSGSSVSASPSGASTRATQGFTNGTSNYTGAPETDGFSGGSPEDEYSASTSWLEPGNKIYTQSSRYNLTDDEKKQLKHGLSTMEKLAGEDRRLNSNDLANSAPQFQVKPFLKPGDIAQPEGKYPGGMSVKYMQSILENQNG